MTSGFGGAGGVTFGGVYLDEDRAVLLFVVGAVVLGAGCDEGGRAEELGA